MIWWWEGVHAERAGPLGHAAEQGVDVDVRLAHGGAALAVEELVHLVPVCGLRLNFTRGELVTLHLEAYMKLLSGSVMLPGPSHRLLVPTHELTAE